MSQSKQSVLSGYGGVQDVDSKLRDFQDKQNIDIGLIMGPGNNNASLVSDKMPVIPRPGIMRMGATRSLSVSKCFFAQHLHRVMHYSMPCPTCFHQPYSSVGVSQICRNLQ